MALAEIHIAHLPPSISIFVGLYTEVKNAAFLRSQLLAGNEEFEYAFIDASMVLSPTHILAAVFRATNDALHNRLKSRNVHSEIVFNLSPNNNIAESFRRFGIADDSANILTIKVVKLRLSQSDTTTASPTLKLADVQAHLDANVHGQALPFGVDSLAGITNQNAIRKIYKLNSDAKRGRKSGKRDADVSQGDAAAAADNSEEEVELAVLALMALKGS